MRHFETKHERNSAKITGLIILILVLLLFVVGPLYQDPPPEYGVAINFGNSITGNGNVQSDPSIKSKNLNTNKAALEDHSKVKETIKSEAESVSEKLSKQTLTDNVLTHGAEESLEIKKEKEVKKNTEEAIKTKFEAAAKAKAAAQAKKRKEEAEKKRKLDEMMGGLNNSKGETAENNGNQNEIGDKGQLNGNPYSASYFGDPGTGTGRVGYGLNGRGNPTKQVFKQNCNESGLIIVRIEVDRSGRVIKAQPGVKGTNNTATCLLEPAKKIALSHKWKADAKAPTRQVGFVSINFKLGQ